MTITILALILAVVSVLVSGAALWVALAMSSKMSRREEDEHGNAV